MSDSLENGAGYSSPLGHAKGSRGFAEASDRTGRDLEQFRAHCAGACGHARKRRAPIASAISAICRFTTSLIGASGLDLARLALDPHAPIRFPAVPYWHNLVAPGTSPAAAYAAAQPQWQFVTFAGVPAARRGPMAEIIVHPLWNTTPGNFCPQLNAAYAQAQAEGVKTITCKSIFEVVRRPF